MFFVGLKSPDNSNVVRALNKLVSILISVALRKQRK
jgi:hypothetical protein